jgi:hypothetical protein
MERDLALRRVQGRVLAIPLLCLASSGFAQESTPCPDCIIGVYDDVDLAKNYGTWTSATKSFFLGIRYGPSSGYESLSGIEFSIDGLPVMWSPLVTPLNGGIRIGGSLHTPPDTTAAGAAGGWAVAWPVCQTGNIALVEFTLVSFDPIQNDLVIRVHRRFPSLSTPSVLFTTCEFPVFPKVRVTGGCYVVNPTVRVGESVGDPPCTLWADTTPIEARTWSQVKELYR